jgi:glycosyltransferase involved in cell wall biosynthesis
MPTLTVLMPVYNAERFLAEAIESILGQTFTGFEFLIIDDCSTDNSVNIIKSYTDPRIRFHQNEKNIGISLTLNYGIELAETELIARMDSDDISYCDRLQKQLDFIAEHPDGALYSCWTRVINQQGEFIRQEEYKSEFYYYNLVFICWIYHPTIVFIKKAVKEVGMYSVPYAEDFELFWQLSRKFKIYNIPRVLLDYRITDQSLHQVLKKKEYEEAQHKQLLRNFRYYAGESYTIPISYIECLQHNLQPLLEEQSVSKVADCIYELEFLTQQILNTENINRDVVAIERAAYFKRKFIIDSFTSDFSSLKAVLLLLKLREFGFLKKYIKDQIKELLSLNN